MTKEQKIKVLAELNGFTCSCKDGKWDESHGDFNCEVHGDNTKWYLTSYDAIIPLIQKQPFSLLHCFLDNLCIITNGDSAEMDGSYKELTAMWKASPEQLSDALIKAHGKWEED